MYTILIGMLLGALVGAYLRSKDQDDFMPNLPLSMLIFSVTGTIMAFFIAAMIGVYSPQCNEVSTDTIKFYSGYTLENISGRFFILSGSITSDNYVYYWKEYPDGKKVQEKQPMDSSFFYEEDRKDGTMTVHNYYCGWSDWGFTGRGGSTYEFHVPYGSIYTGYTIK